MGESNSVSVPISSSGLAAATETKRTGLSFKEYQELKSSVHRDLISRVDLERVANQRDEYTRGQVLSVIQDLVANLKTPLSGVNASACPLKSWTKCSGWAPWSRCYKIRLSTTF